MRVVFSHRSSESIRALSQGLCNHNIKEDISYNIPYIIHDRGFCDLLLDRGLIIYHSQQFQLINKNELCEPSFRS